MRARNPRTVAALLAAATPLAAGGVAVAHKPDDHPSEPRRSGKASFTYTLPGNQVYPEGIAVTRNSKRFFVTSTTDGTIFRGSVRGRTARVFLPGGEDGRTTAAGIKTIGDRLYVAGRATGSIFIYDISSRELVRRVDTGPGGFINDLAVMRNGDVYATDSRRPNLYRIPAAASQPVETIEYPDFDAAAFNANGIVRVDDRTLVYVNTGNGRLYRVDTRTERITAVNLGGRTLTFGDGMELRGRTLYVVRNREELIAKVRLSRSARRGRLVSQTTDRTFRFPTTLDSARGRLLVVNSQFDRREGGNPVLPFTVSSIRRR
jgi:Cu-Zn family superoxide dismutase